MTTIITDKDILAMVSEEIDVTSEYDMRYARIVLKELEETLENSYNGVGLAAPQIQHFIRLFIFRLNNGMMKHIINPWIIDSKEDFMTSVEEGCLSCPGIKINTIERYNNIKVGGYSIKGKPFTMYLIGLEAIIFQHELDHLNGKLIIDYME